MVFNCARLPREAENSDGLTRQLSKVSLMEAENFSFRDLAKLLLVCWVNVRFCPLCYVSKAVFLPIPPRMISAMT